MSIIDIYDEALSIWQHSWDTAYAEGASKEDKHKIRRDKLVEYLQGKDITALTSLLIQRIITCEAKKQGRMSKFYKSEQSACRGILTVITKEGLTN